MVDAGVEVVSGQRVDERRPAGQERQGIRIARSTVEDHPPVNLHPGLERPVDLAEALRRIEAREAGG